METLYRKYRPIDFDTVVGQDTVVKTLKNQITKGSIAHAYLFCGTRGTGKTTVAKIFARTINCPNENNGNPCNECETCLAALSGNNLNIVEMDAASNRRIEDIRRISDQIAYPPINGEKYKVFIIDEAHALTSEATQGFLKILEEPPEYVVYILATTDPNKLPETILSRCQKYNFKRINIETISAYLRKICDAEKISIDDDSLDFIAEKSDGSMRESISKLDRSRAFASSENLDKVAVANVLGIVDDDDFRELVKAVNESDIKKAFTILSECVDKGKDITQFANDFIWHLRNLLIVKDLKEPVETLNITKNNFDKLKKETESIAKETLIYYIEELSKTANSMKFDDNRRVILETSIIRLATPRANFLESSVMARVSYLEDKVAQGSFVNMSTFANANVSYDDEDNKNSNEQNGKANSEIAKEKKVDTLKLSPATFEEVNKVIESWKTLISSMEPHSKGSLTNANLAPGNEKEPGYIEVLIDDPYEMELFEARNIVKEIEETLSNNAKAMIGKDIIFKLKCTNETNYSKNLRFEIDESVKSKIAMPIGEEDDDKQF